MKIRTAAIIEGENKILCLRYNYPQATIYTLPGGNLNFGESMKESLMRELFEELMIRSEVIGHHPIITGEMHVNGKDSLHVIFEAKITYGIPSINSNETSAQEVVWLPFHDLQSYNLYPNIAEALLRWKQGSLCNGFIGQIDQAWY